MVSYAIKDRGLKMTKEQLLEIKVIRINDPSYPELLEEVRNHPDERVAWFMITVEGIVEGVGSTEAAYLLNSWELLHMWDYDSRVIERLKTEPQGREMEEDTVKRAFEKWYQEKL